jgi:Acetyltransferase (GNAT) domain
VAMGAGVGRALWAAAVQVARTLPFDELRLAADPNAEQFYARMGARRIGEVGSEVVHGRRLPLMAFDLRA